MPRVAPSRDEFRQMVSLAYDALPRGVRALTTDIVIRVEDEATQDILDELEIDHPLDLLGLYQGLNLAERGDGFTGALPDMVFLYFEPIIHYWKSDPSPNSLKDIVRNVLVHEIGHHFGLSDEDMDRIENDDRPETAPGSA